MSREFYFTDSVVNKYVEFFTHAVVSTCTLTAL